jgi:hypothetical protein
LLLPALALLIGLALRLRIGAGLDLHRPGVIAAGMLVRARLWSAHVDAHTYGIYFYYKLIYYSSLCRLDELVAGVALALLKNRHPRPLGAHDGPWQPHAGGGAGDHGADRSGCSSMTATVSRRP